MSNQPLADAFFAGRDAFRAGKELTECPFAGDTQLAYEWTRGYKNTRKQARFDATIAKRREKGE